LLAIFYAVITNRGWKKILAEEITFNSPTGEFRGKESFIQMTNQFKQGVVSTSVKTVIAEGDKASVLTLYQMAIPTGEKFDLDVSEIINVRGQKISSFEIYFDTAKLNAFMSKMNN